MKTRKLLLLSLMCAAAHLPQTAPADVVKMTPLTTFVSGTNATLVAAKAYTDEHSGVGVTSNAVRDISRGVTSNIVTKAYVESLGIESGLDTNAVRDIIAPATNATLAAAKTYANSFTNGLVVAPHAYEGRTGKAADSGAYAEAWATNGYVSHASYDYGYCFSLYSTVVKRGFTDQNSYIVCDGTSISLGESLTTEIVDSSGYTWDLTINRNAEGTKDSPKIYITNQGNSLTIPTFDGATGYIFDSMSQTETEDVPSHGTWQETTTNYVSSVASRAYADKDGREIGATYATPLAVTNIVNGLADYAVTTSVTNAVDTAMTDLLGSNWRTTYGGGLAGVLAAIFAAIAVLNRKKVGSFSAVGGQTPTVTNGVADVSSLFSRVDTSSVTVDNLLNNAELEKSMKVCAQHYGGGGTATGVEITDSATGAVWQLTCANGIFTWVIKES